VLAVLFLTVAVLPASVLRTTVLASVDASEDYTGDQEKIVLGSFVPGTELIGLTVNSLANPDNFFLLLVPDQPITSELLVVMLDIGGAVETESAFLSLLRHLAALSMNPGVWAVAFFPGVWSVMIWRVRAPRRRRSRRHEYERLLR